MIGGGKVRGAVGVLTGGGTLTDGAGWVELGTGALGTGALDTGGLGAGRLGAL